MKNIAKMALLTGILVVPAFAHAYWWNPLTWGWVSTPEPQTIEEGTPEVDIPSSSVTDEPIVTPDPKVVVKYIDNPQLTLQVQELMRENEAINNQIIGLKNDNLALTNSRKDIVNQLNQCKSTGEISTSAYSASIVQKAEKNEEYLSNIRGQILVYIDLIKDKTTNTAYSDPELVGLLNSYLDKYRAIDPNMAFKNLLKIHTTRDDLNRLYQYLMNYK